jgi:hypothetical protein
MPDGFQGLFHINRPMIQTLVQKPPKLRDKLIAGYPPRILSPPGLKTLPHVVGFSHNTQLVVLLEGVVIFKTENMPKSRYPQFAVGPGGEPTSKIRVPQARNNCFVGAK